MKLKTYAAPRSVARVQLDSDEVTTMCPVMGNPDYYNVFIDYAPNERIVCTKSLKEWFTSQRDQPHGCEGFARDIRDLIVHTLDTSDVEVIVTQKARGGITIRAYAGPDIP